VSNVTIPHKQCVPELTDSQAILNKSVLQDQQMTQKAHIRK